MQPYIADGVQQLATSTSTTDRRTSERRGDINLVVTRYVVVLNLGPAHRAVMVDESNDGIAVQVREVDRSADVGRAIDVIYRGKRRGAEIRHITENEHGFLVGLQWQNRYLE